MPSPACRSQTLVQQHESCRPRRPAPSPRVPRSRDGSSVRPRRDPRRTLHDLPDHGLLTRCAGLRPGPLDTPTASAKHTLRALARRWIALAEEIATHDRHLARLTTETSPTLREGFGVGARDVNPLLR